MARPLPGLSILVTGTLLATFVVVLVTAIVLGIRSQSASESLARLEDTSISVILNESCTTDRFINPRRAQAYQTRVLTAFDHYATPVACHTNNGDEALYAPVYFSQFSKGMQHDSLGHVDPTHYASLLHAVNTRTPSSFDAILQASGAIRDFTNPQASMALVLQGADPQSFHVVPAPEFSSAEQAGEMVEAYWQAYTRDVPFSNYSTDSKTLAAVAELNGLSDFRGPKPVTPQNLFRGLAPGCDVGPYVSQFLYLPCNMGANSIDQRIYPFTTGVDFMTNFSTYLAQQNAQPVEANITYESTKRHLYTGRDLSYWVHMDALFQAYLQAVLCLLNMNAPLKPGIPYQTSGLNQMGFGTFGPPDLLAASTIGATTALKTAWAEKWLYSRRLRPEVFAARVHNHLTSVYTYPIHNDVLSSSIVGLIFAQYGSYLLPQAFSEGSPVHPSYPAGKCFVCFRNMLLMSLFL